MSEFKQYTKSHGGRCPYPAVSVNFDNGIITILTVAYEEMGRPTYVNIYGDSNGKIALEPTNANERNKAWSCYRRNHNDSMSADLSFKQVTRMRETDELRRYGIEQDNETGYWVFDINDD